MGFMNLLFITTPFATQHFKVAISDQLLICYYLKNYALTIPSDHLLNLQSILIVKLKIKSQSTQPIATSTYYLIL